MSNTIEYTRKLIKERQLHNSTGINYIFIVSIDIYNALCAIKNLIRIKFVIILCALIYQMVGKPSLEYFLLMMHSMKYDFWNSLRK